MAITYIIYKTLYTQNRLMQLIEIYTIYHKLYLYVYTPL